MSDNVIPLPQWKDDASAEERLMELAFYARQHPERFMKMVLIYEETKKNGFTSVRWISDRLSTNELIGIIEVAKSLVISSTER